MLDCALSYVDSSKLLTDGFVIVCLTNDSGTKYFDNFDIGGGPATNASQANTGFVTGTSSLIQDYNVDPADEPSTHQCFYLPYTGAAGETSDTLVLQPTDAGVPVGDACEFTFNIPTDGTEPGNDLNCVDSYVDSSILASQGKLIVCLQHVNGTPFFLDFDIGGGPATNASVSVTGFVNGSTDLVQDYNVDAAHDSTLHQCFYINYTPFAGATQDRLVIQPINNADPAVPIGDACELVFDIPAITDSIDCSQSNWL